MYGQLFEVKILIQYRFQIFNGEYCNEKREVQQ